MEKFLTDTGAGILYNDLRNSINKINTELRPQMSQKIDGAFVSEDGKYLHLTADGVDYIGPLGPFSGGGGGGGGGGGNNARLTITNMTEWGRSTSVAVSSSCIVKLYWESIEDGEPTGNGTMTVKLGTEVLRTANVAQGEITVNVTEYLQMGLNNIFITIADVYDNSRTLSFSITVTTFSLESTIDPTLTYTGTINFPYIATGDATKLMHFILDGELIGTKEVKASGRSETFVITKDLWQTHGVHTFESYFTAQVSGSDLTSNRLSYEFLCVDPEEDSPLIASTFSRTSVKQYETINIPFIIYNPDSQVSEITLTIEGEGWSQSETRENVPNNIYQSWSYRVMKTDDLIMTITLGSVSRVFNLELDGSIIPISPVEDDSLSLYLTSAGRNNLSSDHEIWEYKDIKATFKKFNWVSDGWLADKDGYTALLVKGDATVEIPYEIFSTDLRAQGKTIEVEFATTDVNDYTAPIITCMEGGIGLKITAQDMTLSSQQKSLMTQFKEDEHVRISFVIDPTTTDRLILCYINGVLSGVDQYPSDDNFQQPHPVIITIGSKEVTTQIYNIRVYDRPLSRFDIVHNWICDKQDADEMLAAFEHNDVYDETYSQILMEKLPKDLPYMVIYPQRTNGTHTLPVDKTDKIPCDGYYVDPINKEKSFTFTDAEIAVQGTSSAIYPIKNFKIKFKKDKDPLKRPNFSWIQTETGSKISKWAMNAQAIPTHTFTFKADYASSEGANNVELVRLYNNISKTVYKTPPQSYDEDAPDEEKAQKDKIRVGIDGFPIVIYYNNGKTVSFLGKYNFNNDKGTEDVYGFKEGDQSWEITSNVSELANWQSDDLSPASKPLKWKEAFEDRYPDKGDDARIDDLQVLSTWLTTTARGNIYDHVEDPATGDTILVDTGVPVWADLDRTAELDDHDEETGALIYHGPLLPEPQTYQRAIYDEDGELVGYEDVEFNEDNADYRLAKFRAELENHLSLKSSMLYYLFTEVFLLVDSRAKNAFPTRFAEDGKWCWIPYDMDTALGINNEGKLTFGYSLEDTDTIGGANVYNGQHSTMWCNLRDAFPRELKSLYQDLIGEGLTYEDIEKQFEQHQSKWPEMILNEDAYSKYIRPFLDAGSPYLEMCLGTKAEQRKWWLYNRFRYVNSKYEYAYPRADDPTKACTITFRAYGNSDLNIIPYADIYARFRMGGKEESPAVKKRAWKNDVTTLHVDPGKVVDDLDCTIFSADQLKEVGDMSGFIPATCDFSAAIKLQKIKVGRAIPNEKLTNLSLGNNVLLKSINAINCVNLPDLNASNCTNLEELYLEGCESLTSVTLPEGGMMTTLHLPANMTNLTVKNQPKITDFVLEGTDSIRTLVFDTVSPTLEDETLDILEALPDRARVRLWNFEESFDSIEELEDFIDNLDRMTGIDGSGRNTDIAQILGTATIPHGQDDPALDYEYYAWVRQRGHYTNLQINGNIKKTVRFHNWDGTLKDTQYFTTYTGVKGGVPYEGFDPEREDSETIHYVWDGWATQEGGPLVFDTLKRIDDIEQSYDLYAHYEEIPIYTVKFFSYDGVTQLGQDKYTTRPDLGSYVDYDGPTPTSENPIEYPAQFIGWGTEAYAGVNYETEGNRVINIHESVNLIAQMEWQMIDNTIQVTGNYKEHYYAQYESFDPTNMVVEVMLHTPKGDFMTPVINYTYTTEILTAETTQIDVTVNAGNIAHVPVFMANKLEVSKDPNKYFQYTGQILDLTGMQVTVTFADGETVTDSDLSHFYYMVPGLEPGSEQVLTEEGYQNIQIYYYKGELTCLYEILALQDIKDIFEENSWPAISAIVNTNRVPQAWSLGDQKTIYLSTGGGFNGYYTVRILAFDHNLEQETPVDPETGEKLYEHSLTLGLAQLKRLDNPPIKDMREVATEVCKANAQLDGEDELGQVYEGWTKSWHFGNGQTEVCQKILRGLPAELRRLIKPVIKGQADIADQTQPVLPIGGFKYGAIQTQENYVYLPSLYELTGLNSVPGHSYDKREANNILESTVCKQFAYYQSVATTESDRVKYGHNSEPAYASPYWTRTWLYTWRLTSEITYYYYSKISNSGTASFDNAINSDPVMFCFTL